MKSLVQTNLFSVHYEIQVINDIEGNISDDIAVTYLELLGSTLDFLFYHSQNFFIKKENTLPYGQHDTVIYI